MTFLQVWTTEALDLVRKGVANLGHGLLAPGSGISLTSLASALVLAGVFLLVGRRNRRETSLKALARAMFPRRIVFSRSTRIDAAFFLFNALVFGAVFGWAIVGQGLVSRVVLETLEPAIGKGRSRCWARPGPDDRHGSALPGRRVRLLDRPLAEPQGPDPVGISQGAPQREVLTPLTNFRVHPVEAVKFANILAITMGLANAALTWGLGEPTKGFTVFDRNILSLAGLYLVQHLQHTHLWLIAPGRWPG